MKVSIVSADDRTQSGEKLPRRDWVLLPLIGLLTMCLLAASADLIARRRFSSSKTSFSACMGSNDPSTGIRAIPNSVCWEKGAESDLTEYRFNSCGHRAGVECGPRAVDTFRIVAIGSSYAMGDRVAQEKSFAGLLPAQLSGMTGRKIELYNEGMLWGTPHSTALRFNRTLQSQSPDLILWVLTPWDIQNAGLLLPNSAVNSGQKPPQPAGLEAKFHFVMSDLERNWISPSVSTEIDRTRTMLQHYLYQSRSQYLKSYLASGEAEFLKAEPSEEWKARLMEFDGYAADMESRSAAAGVPFVAVLVPNRSEAAMISMGSWPDGYDPYKLGDELRAIITSHGGTYVDILPGFRDIANPEQYYFPVDDHPDAGGHAIIASLLAHALTSGAVPAVTTANRPQVATEKGR
jgi:hypothetical protein